MIRTEIITGVFSLAGVIIGAVATVGTQLYLERRRDKWTVRQAARLIDADLMAGAVAAQTSIDKKAWWVNSIVLNTDGWREKRDVIASKLPWNNWMEVIVAVQAVSDLQAFRDVDLKIQRAKLIIDREKKDVVVTAERLGLDILDASPKITDTTVEQVKVVLKDINTGRAALVSLARGGVIRRFLSKEIKLG
jgi:hypothetical protein